MAKTCAVIGASNDRRKFGNKSLRAHQMAGYEVYPVNTTESEVEGLTAYASIRDVPVERLHRVGEEGDGAAEEARMDPAAATEGRLGRPRRWE